MHSVWKKIEVKFCQQSEINDLWNHLFDNQAHVIAALTCRNLGSHLICAFVGVIDHVDTCVLLEDIDQIFVNVFTPCVDAYLLLWLHRQFLLQILQLDLESLLLSHRRLSAIIVAGHTSNRKTGYSRSRSLQNVSST